MPVVKGITFTFEVRSTEPEITVTTGAREVPVSLTEEFGLNFTVEPLPNVTSAADAEVLIMSPDTSGNELTPGVSIECPSREKGALLVTVAMLPAVAARARTDKSTTAE